jgi:hypothetical protein
MRLHWLRGRVRQGHFRARHIPGLFNIAGFFTKSLHVNRHRALALAPHVASDSPSSTPPSTFLQS